jgi:hypothetical protein
MVFYFSKSLSPKQNDETCKKDKEKSDQKDIVRRGFHIEQEKLIEGVLG